MPRAWWNTHCLMGHGSSSGPASPHGAATACPARRKALGLPRANHCRLLLPAPQQASLATTSHFSIEGLVSYLFHHLCPFPPRLGIAVVAFLSGGLDPVHCYTVAYCRDPFPRVETTPYPTTGATHLVVLQRLSAAHTKQCSPPFYTRAIPHRRYPLRPGRSQPASVPETPGIPFFLGGRAHRELGPLDIGGRCDQGNAVASPGLLFQSPQRQQGVRFAWHGRRPGRRHATGGQEAAARGQLV